MPIQSPVFSHEVINNRDYVTITGTDLIISVYALKYEPFRPSDHTMVFYGDDNGIYLAFVIEGWSEDTDDKHLLLVTRAIMWYAQYLDYPQMKLQLQDPRPHYNPYN